MKTTQLLPAALIASALLSTAAWAQNSVSASVPVPSMAAAQPTEYVYVPQLPTPNDLVNGAKTQGVTVSKISQMPGQVIAVYTYPNGQVSTVAFQILPAGEGGAAGSAPAGVPQPTSPAPAVVGQAVAYAPPSTTTVIYDAAPVYGYYPAGGYYPYGYGYGWYPPVSIGLGFGWGGGYRGGYRGGWGGGFHGGGGFHR
jgi:hypothetical protein